MFQGCKRKAEGSGWEELAGRRTFLFVYVPKGTSAAAGRSFWRARPLTWLPSAGLTRTGGWPFGLSWSCWEGLPVDGAGGQYLDSCLLGDGSLKSSALLVPIGPSCSACRNLSSSVLPAALVELLVSASKLQGPHANRWDEPACTFTLQHASSPSLSEVGGRNVTFKMVAAH